MVLSFLLDVYISFKTEKEIAASKEERAASKERYAREIAALKERYDQEMANTKARNDSELEAMKERSDRQMAAVVGQITAALSMIVSSKRHINASNKAK